MHIAHSPAKLKPQLEHLRRNKGRQAVISLVTTRGDLHDGHGAVINAAATISDHVVVARFPVAKPSAGNVISAREFQDISFSDQHQADIVYAPSIEYLYPDGVAQASLVSLSEPLTQLEYDPVALTTHLKIINAVQPDVMVWGERNYIEYMQVRRLIEELDLQTQLHCIPTVRHSNGVAVSGHDDAFMDSHPDAAQAIYETLKDAAHAIRSGASNYNSVERTAKVALKGAGYDIVYFCILDDITLNAANESTNSFRLVCRLEIQEFTVVDCLSLTL